MIYMNFMTCISGNYYIPDKDDCEGIDIKEKRFIPMIDDSLQLLSIVEKDFLNVYDKNPYIFQSVYGSICRSAFITILLSIESAINILMDSEGILSEKNEKDSLEKKINKYLHKKINKAFDMDSIHYKLLKELKQMRNDYVHPKTKEGKLYDGMNEFYGYYYENIDIYTNFQDVCYEDCLKVLRAVIDLVNYIVVDTCKIDINQSTLLFVNNEIIAEDVNFDISVSLSEMEKEILKDGNIQIKFLKIDK